MTRSSVASRRSSVASLQSAVLLCALAIAAYANAFSTGFAFDSRQLVLQDSRVQAVTLENVGLIARHTYWWPYGESGLYRPATTLTYLLNYSALRGGERAWSYHAVNLLLHVVNVLLVWQLVARITGNPDVALAAAAIWAVLPLSVEAVTNIAGRADLLAACGVLAGLLLYRRSWIGLALATTLAVFSKESGIVIAPLILCYELASWDRETSRLALAFAAAALVVPFAAMWAARWIVLGAAPPAEFAFIDNPIVGASWIVGRLTAIKATGMYLWKLAWPAKLSADYSFDAISLARGSTLDWLAWATVAAIVGIIVVAARRSRAAAFFGAFAIVAFVPASNLLFATGTIFGERLMYLPAVGLVALVALALARVPRVAFLALATMIVVAFGARTWVRNPDWASDVTLWRAAVVAEPSSAKAHHALAEALYDADATHANLELVMAEAQRAVAILNPLPDDRNFFQAFRQAGAYHLDKATALAGEGRPEFKRALPLLKRAAAIEAAGATAYGRGSVASEADIQRLLAAAFLGVHDAEDALAAATHARDLDPLAPLPYRQMATAQLMREDADAAATTLMVGSMVTADRGLTQALLGLYAAGLDESGCATTVGPSGTTMNTGCAIVQRHLCAAAPEAARLDAQLGRLTEAERVQSTARSMTSCGH